MDKKQLLDDLYEVLYNTENEEAFALIGNVIEFIMGGANE